jgi:hypothetical protein
MARLSDAVLEKEKMYAGVSPAANLIRGGQSGYMPKIGTISEDGKTYDEWVSDTSYVSTNVIPVLMRVPGFFKYMQDKDKWVATYKALIELHPLTITGLTSGLTVEFDETPVGGSGEMLESLTDVKRARSSLNTTYKEKANKAIGKFFDILIRYGMMDPDTKKPLVSKLINDMDQAGIYTSDFYTGTVMYIEPDITQKFVVDAWLRVNMMPKSNGERTGQRNLAAAGSGKELSIDWTGITMNNEAVLKLAQTTLSGMTVLDKLPDTDMIAPNAQGPDANVNGSEAGKVGYQKY